MVYIKGTFDIAEKVKCTPSITSAFWSSDHRVSITNSYGFNILMFAGESCMNQYEQERYVIAAILGGKTMNHAWKVYECIAPTKSVVCPGETLLQSSILSLIVKGIKLVGIRYG